MALEESPNSLLNSLEKLELDASCTKKPNSVIAETAGNVFMKRRRSKSLSSINFGTTCDCLKKSPQAPQPQQQNIKHTTSFKRTNKKILRDPILKLIKCSQYKCSNEPPSTSSAKPSYTRPEKLFGQFNKGNDLDFKSIVDACEQLTLDNTNNNNNNGAQLNYTTASFLTVRAQSSGNVSQRSEAQTPASMGSCSHQARLNHVAPPCDVTIDELASYFETFVHIPKKMSSMAEMMYI